MACDRELLDCPRPESSLRITADHLAALAQLVDVLPCPVVVLECTGQVCFANKVAQAEVDRFLPWLRQVATHLCPWTEGCPGGAACMVPAPQAGGFPFIAQQIRDGETAYRVHLAWLTRERPGLLLATWMAEAPCGDQSQRHQTGTEPVVRGDRPPAVSSAALSQWLESLETVRANTETTARFTRAEQESLERDVARLAELSRTFEAVTDRLMQELDELLELLGKRPLLESGVAEQLQRLRQALNGQLDRGRLLCRCSLRAAGAARTIGDAAAGIADEVQTLMERARLVLGLC